MTQLVKMAAKSICKYVTNIIVAHSWPEYGIGMQNKLPWCISADLKRFSDITTNNIVIMGRKTWESLPDKVRPLPNRLNIVITNNPNNYYTTNNTNIDNVNVNAKEIDNTKQKYKDTVFIKWDDLVGLLNSLYYSINDYIMNDMNILQNVNVKKYSNNVDVFFIGGEEIYRRAVAEYEINRFYITEVYKNEKRDDEQFDRVFPKPSETGISNIEKYGIYDVTPIKRCAKSGLYYRFMTYSIHKSLKGNEVEFKSPEQQYLNIMRQIMERGIERDDRTGTGTLSIFSSTQRYDLSSGEFPISTTKRIFFRAIYEELALYLSGKTDNGILQKAGIHIWDGNTSREFLDHRGLNHYPEGDMGETYGFNFRHFGGEYIDCKTDYPPGLNGYDQLENVLHLIKTDPTSRRIIINLWNPATLHKAALPSCLMMYQFYVDTHAKTLSCQIYIRSSDYFLANNWNACTGALLVHMICNLSDIDLTPGELIVITGDTHLYKNHLKQVSENLQRIPKPFPRLAFKNGPKQSLTDYTFEDLRLVGYKCGASIKAEMAV